jgi:hypothetical protein
LKKGLLRECERKKWGIWTNKTWEYEPTIIWLMDVDGARRRKVGTLSNNCAKKPMVKGFNPLWKY